MRFTVKIQNRELNEQTNLWDAFVTYLDSIYFPGAAETLEKKLLAFECCSILFLLFQVQKILFRCCTINFLKTLGKIRLATKSNPKGNFVK